MRGFYMVWVAGTKPPTKMHTELQAALDEAQRLRREETSREVYVLAPLTSMDGRPLAHVVPGLPCHKQPMVPAVKIRRRKVLAREATGPQG